MIQPHKTPFTRAFEHKNIKLAVAELKDLPGKPFNKFDVLLDTGIATGDHETALKIGVKAYSILRPSDVTRILSPQNGPTERLELFLEIMKESTNGLAKNDRKRLYYLLNAYCAQHKVYGNCLPKTWLSNCISELYEYKKDSALSRYLYLYSVKSPLKYEYNVAKFISSLVSKDGEKILHTLALGSFNKRNIQHEALHALTLVSEEQAIAFAKMLLERQNKREIYFNAVTINFARGILEQH